MTNKDYIQTLYECVRDLGLVSSQYEFGRLCGRKESWLSASKCLDRPMTLGALVTLAYNLERKSHDHSTVAKQRQIKDLTDTVWMLVEGRARISLFKDAA